MSEGNRCRWGFLSTASIGRKNWLAIHQSGNGEVRGVASRSIDKAQSFIDECQADYAFEESPVAFGSYDEMLASSDIDAVYIPLPTGLRHDWVIKAAEAKKHVLCEKPCARDAAELKAMTDACASNGVQFMDGIMYVHTERLQQIGQILKSENGIGKLRRIAMQFSFCADQDFYEGNIRTNSHLEPHGCLGDLGWYTIRFALFANDYRMPKSVSATMLHQYQREDSPSEVPMEVECRLVFDGDVTATFFNSFKTGHQQWAHLSGTEGHLKVTDFVLPYDGEVSQFYLSRPEFKVEGCEFSMIENRTDYEIAEAGSKTDTSQEAKLFRQFAEIVNSGQLDPFWPEVSMKTQLVLDACMRAAETGEVVEL